jgi:hypothetical protein
MDVSATQSSWLDARKVCSATRFMPGKLMCGVTTAGVALGKCVEYGYTMAKEVARYLESDGAAGYIAGPQKTQDEAFYQAEIPITNGSGNQ